jgi:hypothetical protein
VAEFFRLIGREYILTIHEKLSDEENMTNACQSEATEAEIIAKTPNVELKTLSSFPMMNFFGHNETYQVFVNVNLDLAQTEFALVFFFSKLTHSTTCHVNRLKIFKAYFEHMT